MLEVARRRYAGLGIEFECQDMNQVSGQYDLVISSMVLHHVPDLPLTLRRIGRLVAPGGTVILLDTIGPAPRSRVEHYGWSVKEFLRDLRYAWRRLRVNVEPEWVRHLVSDRWLPADAFADIYGSAFPGAIIETRGGANTMVWHRDPAEVPSGSQLGPELERAAG
jgi:SAM-dependent methyltransferase